jgi:hypothetical protein
MLLNVSMEEDLIFWLQHQLNNEFWVFFKVLFSSFSENIFKYTRPVSEPRHSFCPDYKPAIYSGLTTHD